MKLHPNNTRNQAHAAQAPSPAGDLPLPLSVTGRSSDMLGGQRQEAGCSTTLCQRQRVQTGVGCELSAARALNPAVSADSLLTRRWGGIGLFVSLKGELFLDVKEVFVSRLSGTERKYCCYRDYSLVFISCVVPWLHESLMGARCRSSYLLKWCQANLSLHCWRMINFYVWICLGFVVGKGGRELTRSSPLPSWVGLYGKVIAGRGGVIKDPVCVCACHACICGCVCAGATHILRDVSSGLIFFGNTDI